MTESHLIVPGVGVGTLKLGDSEDRVRAKAGVPLKEERDPHEVWLYYENLWVQIWPGSEECVSIGVFTPQGGRLSSGLHVGSSWRELLAEFPTTIYDWEGGAWIPAPDVGVHFAVSDSSGRPLIATIPSDSEPRVLTIHVVRPAQP